MHIAKWVEGDEGPIDSNIAGNVESRVDQFGHLLTGTADAGWGF